MNRMFSIIACGVSLSLMLSSCGKKTIETTPIRKDVIETVFASGTLEAEGTYKLTAQTNGYITELNFEEGSILKKSEVLAAIENTENIVNTLGASELLNIAHKNTSDNAPLLLQAEYNIEISKKKMDYDKNLEERYKRLLKNNSISKIDYENTLLNYQTSKDNYNSAIENYNKLKNDAKQQLINSKTNSEVYALAKDKNLVKSVTVGKV